MATYDESYQGQGKTKTRYIFALLGLGFLFSLGFRGLVILIGIIWGIVFLTKMVRNYWVKQKAVRNHNQFLAEFPSVINN